MSGIKATILLLSGGSLVGVNAARSLADYRETLRLLACSSVANEPALRLFDEAWLTPEIKHEEAMNRRFTALLDAIAPDLVIPCRDADVAWLARRGEAFPREASKYLCGPTALAEGFLDKFRSAALAKRFDLPFADTIACDVNSVELYAFARAHGFPLVAKPRSGFASIGVRILANESELASVVAREDYVLQRYVGDSERTLATIEFDRTHGAALFRSYEEAKISIQTRIGKSGELLGVFSTRNTMLQGKSVAVELETSDEARELGMQCGRQFALAGWRGPLNIQCQRDRSNRLVIYEFNGRFTGATGARALMGFEEVAETIADWTSWRKPTQSRTTVARVVRYPSDFATDSHWVESMQAMGHHSFV